MPCTPRPHAINKGLWGVAPLEMSSRDPISTAFKSALGSEVVSGPGNYSCAMRVFSTCAAAALAPPKDRSLGSEGVDAILQGVMRCIYALAA